MLKSLLSLLLPLLMIPLLLVNALGGIVAGIWLAVLGEWGTILLGFAMSLAMPIAWSIASLPTAGVLGVAVSRMDARPADRPPWVMLTCAAAFQTSLLCGWVLLVFIVFERRIDGSASAPFLLWAYSTMSTPLAHMASQERDDPATGTSIGILVAIVAFAGLLVTHFLTDSFEARVAVAAASAAAGIVVSLALSLATDRHERPALRRHQRHPEVMEALALLDDAATDLDPAAYNLVSERVRSLILSDADLFAESMRKASLSVEAWTWGAIANKAGDLVESGHFHMYRGVLDPLGPGEGLLTIFDAATDKLCELGDAEADFAEEQKANVRRNVAEAG